MATFIADVQPDIIGISEIDPGDVLSLATRFAAEWAYRGRQALLWNGRFRAEEIVESYLPAPFPPPLDRRGFLRVRGSLDDSQCTLAITQIHEDRAQRIPELRYVRSQLRNAGPGMLLFAELSAGRTGFADLGFAEASGDREATIWTRGSHHAVSAKYLRV